MSHPVIYTICNYVCTVELKKTLATPPRDMRDNIQRIQTVSTADESPESDCPDNRLSNHSKKKINLEVQDSSTHTENLTRTCETYLGSESQDGNPNRHSNQQLTNLHGDQQNSVISRMKPLHRSPLFSLLTNSKTMPRISYQTKHWLCPVCCADPLWE